MAELIPSPMAWCTLAITSPLFARLELFEAVLDVIGPVECGTLPGCSQLTFNPLFLVKPFWRYEECVVDLRSDPELSWAVPDTLAPHVAALYLLSWQCGHFDSSMPSGLRLLTIWKALS